jgi:hypothetical protein
MLPGSYSIGWRQGRHHNRLRSWHSDESGPLTSCPYRRAQARPLEPIACDVRKNYRQTQHFNLTVVFSAGFRGSKTTVRNTVRIFLPSARLDESGEIQIKSMCYEKKTFE